MSSIEDISNSLISAVLEGRLERVVELIDNYGLSYSQEWSEGYTLLCHAIKNKHTEITKLLLLKGSKVNSANIKCTPLHFAVKYGDIEIVKMLLSKGANVNVKGEGDITSLHIAPERGYLEINCGCFMNGYTPLHLAVEKGSKEIIKLLLSNGAHIDAKGKDDITPLHIAAKRGYSQIVEHLLKHGAYVNCANRGESYTPLHFTVKQCRAKNNFTVVKLLLDYGANIDASDKYGKTILHLAAEYGHSSIIELILKYSPDVNNKSNMSSLSAAMLGSGKEYSKIIESLLQYGFSVNPEDVNNCELLHAAVGKGYLKIVEDLLKYVSDVKMLQKSAYIRGYTLLHLATKNKQKEVATLLINYGVDVNAKDERGKTPIFYSTDNADVEITKLLLTNGANVKDNPDLLTIAVKKKCREIVEILLQHDVDINVSDICGRTALHFTALGEYDFDLYLGCDHNEDPDTNVKGDIAKLLLSRGANVDAKTENGTTTLHAATQKGNVKVVEALLEYNANVNSGEESDIIPLHLCARNGNVVISKMLLNKGADVNAKQKDGITALHIAAREGYKELVEVLLKCSANVNCKDKRNETPLHIAAQHGYLEIVEILLKTGVDIDSRDEYGRTALHNASNGGHIKTVVTLLEYGTDINITTLSAQNDNAVINKMLLNKGVDVNAKQKDGITALHIAAREGYKELVEVLLKCGANVNSIDARDRTPLHMTGYLEIVKILLIFGADTDCRDEYGRTALHNASKEGLKEVVVALLEYGSDINITTKNNHTPLDFALAYINPFHDFDDDNDYDNYDFDEYYGYDNYDSDEDYGYNYDHLDAFCSSEEIAVILKQQIIMRKTANLYVSRKNLLSISSNNEMNDFLYECEKELEGMKSEKISTNYVSFHDIVTKSVSQLAKYARNENIVQILKSDDYQTKFPIYASMIKSHFRKGMERKELLEQANEYFHSFFNSFPELPYNCIEKIISYLNYKDLRILIDACQPVNCPNINISDVARL